MIGIKDPTSASKNLKRHDLVRRGLSDWANARGIFLVAGHIHRQEREGSYLNIGSGVSNGKIECIEYDGIFQEKIWT